MPSWIPSKPDRPQKAGYEIITICVAGKIRRDRKSGGLCFLLPNELGLIDGQRVDYEKMTARIDQVIGWQPAQTSIYAILNKKASAGADFLGELGNELLILAGSGVWHRQTGRLAGGRWWCHWRRTGYWKVRRLQCPALRAFAEFAGCRGGCRAGQGTCRGGKK
jgi:hypothetical protein